MSKPQETHLEVVIMRPTSAKGKPLDVGKKVNLEIVDAKALIHSGKAVESKKITPEDKEKIQQEEARLKAKEAKKKDQPASEIAIGRVKTGAPAGKSGTGEGGENPEAKGGEGGETFTEEELMEKTNPQLQEILTGMNVEFGKNDNKAKLVELILEKLTASE